MYRKNKGLVWKNEHLHYLHFLSLNLSNKKYRDANIEKLQEYRETRKDKRKEYDKNFTCSYSRCGP